MNVDTDRQRALTPQEVETWGAFVDGGWALMARVTDEMSARGLAVADMRLLEALEDTPDRGISELADAVHMRVSTVSRQIARLIDDGEVEKIKSDGDGRHRLVRLTEQGRATLHEHVMVRDSVIRRHVIDVLSPEEFTALGDVFRRIRAGIPGCAGE
ncbi:MULTISPECIES: MarR family winged helix-turn-helix transcriptional regulator [unclassified Gordonia (in: high G+C Gram-positive bacteria)]|uniref:MarR family winged helix-turn-helix transcriptional regulator n=1 Tax=unclassified Gordonia (in: high G+C Gram-positive bacteria) TaxID=2657482 RepID=UPI001F0EDB33|nr:MarR family winged helix-turn-helix transcriptional regulator [Gordonia sp. ABSL49_1]MCH5643416.1 MarR family winged helix-turn-helix transcriptional regulator [Gordonia sp. ABSL49_1]